MKRLTGSLPEIDSLLQLADSSKKPGWHSQCSDWALLWVAVVDFGLPVADCFELWNHLTV